MSQLTDWTRDEVEAIVGDYFEMLRQELNAVSYSKTRHRHRLGPQLQGRSDGSIEFKHANISAVLVRYGLPYIDGYKPRGNYQLLLEQVVLEYLTVHPDFFPTLPALFQRRQQLRNPQDPDAAVASQPQQV